MPPPITTRTFVGVFVVYSTKSSGKQIRQKPFGSKNVFKAHPGYEAKSISSK